MWAKGGAGTAAVGRGDTPRQRPARLPHSGALFRLHPAGRQPLCEWRCCDIFRRPTNSTCSLGPLPQAHEDCQERRSQPGSPARTMGPHRDQDRMLGELGPSGAPLAWPSLQ